MKPAQSLPSISVSALRTAGLTDEANRLERRVREHTLWSGRSASENVIALSVFGSVGYDRLLEALNAGAEDAA